MTLLGPIIMAVVVVGAILLSTEEPEQQHILVVDESGIFQSIESDDLVKYEFEPGLNLDQALAKIGSPYTAVLHIYKDYYKLHAGSLYFARQPSFRIQRKIERTVQLMGEIAKLNEFNISESDYRRIKTPFRMSTVRYDGQEGTEESTDFLPAVVGFGFAILIYMFIMLYSVQVMRGVIEEKTSRIIEVLISSVKPFQLMMGKIVGIAGVGLTQFVLWVILTGVLIGGAQFVIYDQRYSADQIGAVQMTPELQKQLSEEARGALLEASDEDNLFSQIQRVNFPLMIGLFLFYFVGGYLLYASMMAAIGSAVDNDTDTQQFILPVTFPLLLSYIASFVIFNNPNSEVAQWMSIIPFTSPVTMLVRIAFGNVSTLELVSSMTLLIATFIGMTWIAARIYRVGILMYGKKATLREMYKWIKHP